MARSLLSLRLEEDAVAHHKDEVQQGKDEKTHQPGSGTRTSGAMQAEDKVQKIGDAGRCSARASPTDNARPSDPTQNWSSGENQTRLNQGAQGPKTNLGGKSKRLPKPSKCSCQQSQSRVSELQVRKAQIAKRPRSMAAN